MKPNCVYNVTVYTPLACLTSAVVSLTTSDGNIQYNLTPLMLFDRNYIIKDPTDADIQYSINIGHPVVADQDALCIMNTGICRNNVSEINSKNRLDAIWFFSHSLLFTVTVLQVQVLKYGTDSCSCK